MTQEAVERVLTYTLGGVVGAAIGYLALSYWMPYLAQERTTFIVSTGVLIGVLIAGAILDRRKTITLKNNSAMREEMVAIITHEMRTGLTSTGWAIRFITEKYQNAIAPEDLTMLNELVSSIQRTVMHTVNLLDVSLQDIGKLSIILEWTTLEKVEAMIREVVEKYRYGALQKGIELVFDINLDRTREAEVDVLRLRILTENLLENSLQYTLLDEKRIVLHVANDSVNMYIDVSDTGIGIPKAEQEKIFSEFYRASNARREQGHGSGIGLYMCKQYAEAHHGTISFTSEQNKGTAFHVSIPLKSREDVGAFLKSI